MPDAIAVATRGIYGFQYKAANGWNGVSEALGATHGIEPEMPGAIPLPGRQFQDNPAILGTAGQRLPSKSVVNPPNMSFNHALRFEGQINLFLALFFGIETLSNVTEGTVTVGQQHLYTMHDDLIGINGTGATREIHDDGTTETNLITEVDSFKVDQIVISWTQASRGMMVPTLFMRRVYADAESGIVNTNTEMAAITQEGSDADDHPTDNVVFRMNSQSGGALGSGDVIDIRALTLTLSRGFGAAETVSTDSPYRIEPIPTATNGWNVQLQVTLADFYSRAFWNNHRDGDQLKADVTLSGGLLVGASTETYKHLFNLPALIVPDYRVQRAERLGQQLTLRAGLPTAAATGMSDSAAPHCIHYNERTTKYLA